jgi:DNA polymerase-1
MPKEIGKSFKLGSEPTEEQIEYAALDVAVLKEIMGFQVERLKQLDLVKTAQLEFAIVPALVDIERRGVLIDWNRLEELRPLFETEVQELQKQLVELAGRDINWNSPPQVVRVLNELGFKTDSSSKKALKKFEGPVIDKLLQYRKTTKLMSSFLNKWPDHVNNATGRVHPDFKQLGAETGRFSCSNPNLQQVPKQQMWRDLFIAPPRYKIITVDYGQIELRIIAEFTQDETFLKILQEGGDLHSTTAAAIFGVPVEEVNREQRDIAKSINFGLSYGMGPKLLSENVGIRLAEAKAFISNHEKAYPRVKQGLDQLGFKALRNGYSITPLGRKRFFGPGDSPQHLGRSSVVQGTCGDILKKAILYLHQDLKGLDAHIINLVHDEILIEANEGIVDQVVEIVKRDMKKAGADFLQTVPIEIDIHIEDTWRK